MEQTDFDQSHPDQTSLAQISPEQHLREFAKFIREVRPRYEEVTRLISEYEAQIADLLHYIELHPDLSASKGYRIYKQIAIARRARRACKIEREMLEPVYQYVVKKAPDLSDCLSAVQGRCRASREAIERRVYKCRTDILEQL